MIASHPVADNPKYLPAAMSVDTLLTAILFLCGSTAMCDLAKVTFVTEVSSTTWLIEALLTLLTWSKPTK